MTVVHNRHDHRRACQAIIGSMDDDNAEVVSLPQAPDAIELRHLRAFVAVADELNFGRAAARLYLSQPALSRQIRNLERLVGCDLLRRSTHRVELTLAGEALLDRARGLLRDVDEAVSATRSVGGELLARIGRHWESFAEVSPADLQELRVAFEALQGQFELPPNISIRSVNAGGVPGLLVTPQPEEPATLLYLHGGGYVTGSAFGYRPLAGALAERAGTGVVVPDYRLAPEHPFPAAVEDAVRPTAGCWAGARPGSSWQATRQAAAWSCRACSASSSSASRCQPARSRSVPWSTSRRLAGPGAPHEFDDFRRASIGLYLAGHPADDPLVNPLAADLAACSDADPGRHRRPAPGRGSRAHRSRPGLRRRGPFRAIPRRHPRLPHLLEASSPGRPGPPASRRFVRDTTLATQAG